MKRLIIMLMIGVMLILTGCPDKKDTDSDENKVNVMKVDLKASKVLMNNYMRFLMKRNNGAMRSFYGANMKAKLINTPSAKNPHPIGYKINEGETKDKKVEFKVNVYSGSTNLPYFSDDEFTYVIAIENDKMVINDIIKGKSVELYLKKDSLYKREGDKLKGNLIISLKDLPSYVVPKESSSIEQKFALPKKTFGSCALSPDGKTIIITSYDKNSFIGVIEEGEGEEEAESAMAFEGTKTTGGGQGGKSGGGAGGAGEQSTGGEGQEEAAKTNMKLKTVDFYFDSKVNSVNFSPDGKMFIVEYTPKSNLSQIILYKSKSGEQVKLKSNKQFRKDRFSITKAYFQSENELVFTLSPGKNATPEEKKFKGDWKLDIKKGEMKQIE